MQGRITSQPHAQTLGTRLRTLRKARGLTMVQLAGLVEVTQSAVSQWESGREHPGRGNLVRLARALGTSIGALMGEEAAARGEVAAPFPVAAPVTMPVDVPVYGTAVGGAGGDFSFNGQVADYVRRPPGVLQLRNLYALWVTGDSMAPWNRCGDLIYVSPTRPATAGDHVVVDLHGTDAQEPGSAMVKLLVARTPTQLRLRQYNPALEFDVPLSRVRSVHRVLSLRDLLGV
jgi:phage repressor protein C with HTH and peptisase S24 domain